MTKQEMEKAGEGGVKERTNGLLLTLHPSSNSKHINISNESASFSEHPSEFSAPARREGSRRFSRRRFENGKVQMLVRWKTRN